MLFLSFSLMAQTKQISGTVVDEMGPVAGASVIERGTQNGAVTDLGMDRGCDQRCRRPVS